MTCILPHQHNAFAPFRMVDVFPGNERSKYDANDDDSYGFFFDDDQDDLLLDDQSSSASSIVDGSAATVARLLHDEPHDAMHRHPPLLSASAMEQIAEARQELDDSSSTTAAAAHEEPQWKRLYSTSRDGPSFATFLRNVRGRPGTVLVARTDRGQILGGCATRPWSGRRSSSAAAAAVDNQAEQPTRLRPFLFTVGSASHDELPHRFIPSFEWTGEVEDQVTVVRDGEWRGDDDDEEYSQSCKIGNKSIAMRGGSGTTTFALSVDESFSRGSIQGQDFAIVDFECYSLD